MISWNLSFQTLTFISQIQQQPMNQKAKINEQIYNFEQKNNKTFTLKLQTKKKMRNPVQTGEQNEFLSPGLEHSKMAGSRSMSTDQIIDKLEEKNNTLRRQVTKIERVLSSMKVEEKPRYGITLPEIKPDTIKKELDNAYKQLQIYEYEVQKRRNALSSEAAYVEQVNKIQKVYKEKVEIHERLKREMLQVKHQSKELTKLLKNDVKKMEYEAVENKLTTDIKYLQEKLRDAEGRRAAHISRLEMQRTSIKEMEQDYMKENSVQTLEMLKAKIFKPNANAQLSPSRSILDIQNDAAKQESRVSKIQSEIEEIQDKTPEAYAALQNDAKLLKKMQNDYENKIGLITKERDEASEKNFKSRNKLLEVEYEIQTLEKNIAELKKLIDPSIFKPKLLKSDKKQVSPAKPKGLTILHPFKNIQSGEITKNGKRFSDRALIGKINSKIIGITLYQKQQTNQFAGLQATYKLQDQKQTIKKGNLNTRIDTKKQPFKEESLRLEGEDYFRSIDLFVTKKKKIVGISIVSSKNKIVKIGDLTGERVVLAMKESEYPMCFYGSLLTDGFELLGVEVFETNGAKEQGEGV